MKKRLIFNSLFLVFAIFCFLYYIGMGIFVRFGQSLLWIWPAMGAACLFRYFLVRGILLKGIKNPLPKWFMVLLHVSISLLLMLFIFVESFIMRGSFEKAPQQLDVIFVLGAKVNGTEPSGSLRQRIDAAAHYLRENPDTLCIASGGQGEDEGISEAECIFRELTAMGIDPSRILLEDSSTSTESNLLNCFGLLTEDMTQIGIVSSDFHICRALGMARHLSTLSFYGVPARSTRSGFLHYSVREFFAVTVAYLKGDLSPA